MRVHRSDSVQNARSNMVRSQLRPNGVFDKEILEVFNDIPREGFVPVNCFSIANSDAAIAYDVPGRCLFAPQTLGIILQNLNLHKGDKVLVIGGNYGYTATILFELGYRAFIIESEPMFVSKCREKLKKYGCIIESGPLESGLAKYGPYDAILVEVVLNSVPKAFVEQLSENGKVGLCLTKNDSTLVKAHVFQKKASNLDSLVSFDTCMSAYGHESQTDQFIF